MFSILIPIIGIALITGVLAWLVRASPLAEPFKTWIWWAVLAIGVIWILTLVAPLFGLSLS